jgi:hypothetical protein
VLDPSEHANRLSLDQQIENLHQEIKTYTTTIAALLADGHEVIDAKAHLSHLMAQLEAMMRVKAQAG